MQACAPISPPLRTRCIERTGAPLPPACRWRSYASATTGGLKSATGQPPSLTRRCCTPTRSGSPSPNELSPPRGIGVWRLALLRTLRGSRLGWGDRLAAPFRAHRPPPISDVLMLALAWPAQLSANRRFQKSARGPARKKGRPRLPSVAKQHSRGLGHHAPHGRSVIRLWRAGCVPSEVRRPIRSRDLVQVESSIRHPCLQEEAPRWAHGDHERWVPSPPSPQTWKFVHIPMSWTSRPRAFCKCPGPIAGRLNAPQVWRRSNFRLDLTGRP